MLEDKVSIIIPVYNASKYLSFCLESVISQTYKNLEIILVDDGSEDNSLDICKEFQKKDSRILVIHQENQGVSSARNIGLEKSSGDYICFVDPDDWMECNMVEILYKKMIEMSGGGCSMVVCGCYEEYFLADTWKETKEHHLSETGLKSSEQVKENIQNYMEQWRPEIWNKFFSREMLSEEKFNSCIILGEDFEFLARVYRNAVGFGMTEECLYHFRIDNSTKKKYHTTLFVDEVKREQMILDELLNWGVPSGNAEHYMKGRLLLIAYTSCYYICRYHTYREAGKMLESILSDSTLKKCTDIAPGGKYRRSQRIMKFLLKLGNRRIFRQFFFCVVYRRERK